jgi:hypothetical protein
VNVKYPPWVGVPVIVVLLPGPGLMERPGGRLPAVIDQVVLPLPVELMLAVYPVPAPPSGTEVVVIVNAA